MKFETIDLGGTKVVMTRDAKGRVQGGAQALLVTLSPKDAVGLQFNYDKLGSEVDRFNAQENRLWKTSQGNWQNRLDVARTNGDYGLIRASLSGKGQGGEKRTAAEEKLASKYSNLFTNVMEKFNMEREVSREDMGDVVNDFTTAVQEGIADGTISDTDANNFYNQACLAQLMFAARFGEKEDARRIWENFDPYWRDDPGNDLNQRAAENKRRSGILEEYNDKGLFDRLTTPSYWYDRRGFLADASNMTGSMIPFIAMSTVMPEFGAGAAAGFLGRGLARFGAKKLAGQFEPGGIATGFMQDGFRFAPTGVLDAAANAGEVAEEMRGQGYSDAEIAKAMGDVFAYELPTDFLTQGVFGGLIGGRGFRALGRGGGIPRNLMVNAGAGVLEAGNEGYQEFVQTQAVEHALGKAVGTFMNPTKEERSAFASAAAGTIPMALAGGGRNVVKNWLSRKEEAAQSELQSSAPVSASNPVESDLPDGLAIGFGKWEGVRMDNGSEGCVEAVTKMGCEYSPFLAQELEKGNVYVPTLVQNAGDMVIPFSYDQVERGDVIVYGNDDHVVIADGEGGYVGNSTSQQRVVHGSNYMEMGDLQPTKIIKTGGGALSGGSLSGRPGVLPVMPDFSGLVADDATIEETQEAIQSLIDTDTMTPEQYAAILQAAEMARDTPVGDGTDTAAEAENVNAWQQLLDRKDAKGIFEKDTKGIVQHLRRLGKEQREQRTRAAIENQQQIEATKQALTALQQSVQSAQAQSAAIDSNVQQVISSQTAQPMNTVQVSPNIQMNVPLQPTSDIQIPQNVQGVDMQAMQNAPVQNTFDAPVQQNTANITPIPQNGIGMLSPQVENQGGVAPAPSEDLASGIVQGAAAAQQIQQLPVSQEERAGLLSKVQQWEQPLLSIPEYVAARNRQDWDTASRIAYAAGIPGLVQFYDTLMEHDHRNTAHVTPYAPQQETPHTAASEKAPAPVVGVRPLVPTMLPDDLKERQKLSHALGRFMAANKIFVSNQLRDDLSIGRGKAIVAADKKITAWEEKRAAQEAQAAQSGAVNTAQTAQEGAQGTQNTVQDRMLAQHSAEPQNGSETVREKSAQNQGNKKAADKGDKELADGYETESGRPLSEADPKEFIIKPNGSRNFGEITKAVSDAVMQQSGVSLGMGEIRLRVGNEIEGLIHAKAHTVEAKQAGYSSVEELIADVAQNFNQIYMREPDNVNGKPTYSLVKTGNKKAGIMNGVAPVYFELQSDDGGNYYIVVTAMPKGDTQLARQTKRDRLIYSSPGLGAATVSGNGAVSHDGKAGAANRGGSHTSDKSDGLSTSTISSKAEESKEKSLSDNEREAVKGLSADAKNVYQMVRDKLAGMKNKKVARAASAGAVLLARHADIIARKVRATLGTPFTAMDYYRTWFDPRYGGNADGFTQAAMKKSDATSLSEFSRQMRTPEAGSGSRKKMFLRITAPSGAFVDVAQDDMIHMHNHHPEMTDENFSVIQENMEKFLHVHQDKTGKGDYGGETVLCKIKTPRGVAGVSYELLPTEQTFLKTAFFDNENGIDNWIAKNGTSKDLMYADKKKRQRRVHAYRSPQPDGRCRRQPDSFGRSTSFTFYDTGANRDCQRRKIQSVRMARLAA